MSEPKYPMATRVYFLESFTIWGVKIGVGEVVSIQSRTPHADDFIYVVVGQLFYFDENELFLSEKEVLARLKDLIILEIKRKRGF